MGSRELSPKIGGREIFKKSEKKLALGPRLGGRCKARLISRKKNERNLNLSLYDDDVHKKKKRSDYIHHQGRKKRWAVEGAYDAARYPPCHIFPPVMKPDYSKSPSVGNLVNRICRDKNPAPFLYFVIRALNSLTQAIKNSFNNKQIRFLLI